MPAFSKRHYEAVAKAIFEAKKHSSNCSAGANFIEGYLASDFEKDNPNFDGEKFNTYCEKGHY